MLPRRVATAAAAAGLLLTASSASAGDVAQVVVLDPPQVLAPDERAPTTVMVRNLGAEAWPAGGDRRVGYRLRDADGHILEFEGARTRLPQGLGPGQEVAVCAMLAAPPRDGLYVVEWDLVRGPAGWLNAGTRPASGVERLRVQDRGIASPWHIAVWASVTLAHIWLTSVWVARRLRRRNPPADADEIVYTAVLLALAAMMTALYLASITVGIAVWPVALVLAAGHAGASVANRPSGPDLPALPLAWSERAGIVALAVISAQWLLGDASTLATAGTDAAHYHVPHAVDYALGASLFDLPATGHLYPMGTSVLAAWFIVPFRDPLLVDTTTLPWFLLLVAALGWLFRQCTGVPGLSFAPWLAVGLLKVPIVRTSTLMSADLPFAAAFTSLVAVLLWLTHDDRFDGSRVVVASAATGLLVGSKATGVAAAGLLGGLALAWHARSLLRDTDRWRQVRVLVTAGAVVVATGGIWQVRNLVNYGSPVAPAGLQLAGHTVFRGASLASTSRYHSELDEILRDGGWKSWVYARLALRRRVGDWIMWVAWPLVFVLADAAVARRRGDARLAGRRIALAAYVILAGAALVALVVSAPWSGLRWTDGHGLRYVLPLLILVPFVSVLAAFPLCWPWFTNPRALGAASAVLAAGATLASWLARPPSGAASRIVDVTPLALVTGASLAAVWLLLRERLTPATARRLACGGLAIVAVAAGPLLAPRDRALRHARLARSSAAYTCGESGEAVLSDPPRAQMLRHERIERRTCAARRVFVTTRFDTPLELQGLPYDTMVLTATNAVAVDRELGRSGPGATPCDYVLAGVAELETRRGVPLIKRLQNADALEVIGQAGGVRIFRATHAPER